MAVHYYTVVAVVFHYYTVSVCDVHNMGKSAVKSQGNVEEISPWLCSEN